MSALAAHEGPFPLLCVCVFLAVLEGCACSVQSSCQGGFRGRAVADIPIFHEDIVIHGHIC